MFLPTPPVLATVADDRNVYFDLEIAGEKAGRVVFKLYDNIVPKVCFRAPSPLILPVPILSGQTAANFRGLATGKVSLLPPFLHRLVPMLMSRNRLLMKTYLKGSDTRGLRSIGSSRGS